MKKIVFLFALVLLFHPFYAQQAEQPRQYEDYHLSTRPSEAVAEAKALRLNFVSPEGLFNQKPFSADKHSPIHKVLRDGVLLDFDPGVAKRLVGQYSPAMRLSLPTPSGREVELELIRVQIFSPGFFMNSSTHPGPLKFDPGVHYHGVVKGEPGSIAAISIFENEVMGMFSTPDEGNFVLGPLDAPAGTQKQQSYVLYKDRDFIPKLDMSCGTEDHGEGLHEEDMHSGTDKVMANECIHVYFEVDDNIVTDEGGTNEAGNYILGLFTQAAALFADENLTYKMSQIKFWTSQSPYANIGFESGVFLSKFKSEISSLNGDIGHLVSYQLNGGEAAGFDGLCNSNVDNSLCVSGILDYYYTVPTYSYSVLIVAHEMGHLNGSRHTHACVWNGNNTAIDGCWSTEGSCASPGLPAGGGTIMSYCFTKSVGTNFSLGFGSQPGDRIRAEAASASCLHCNYIGKKIAIAAANGKYIAADHGGSSPLIANRTSVGGWEEFDVVDGGNGYIALRARVNNQYVCAESGGADDLIANRTSIGDWERFTWVQNSTGSISMLAKANNKYVGARNGGDTTLVACCTNNYSWESFYITILGSSKHAPAPAQTSRGLKELNVYPNPADDYLNLKGGSGVLDVEVFDLQGRRLMRQRSTGSLNVSELNAGVYLLKVNGYQTIRFVKR